MTPRAGDSQFSLTRKPSLVPTPRASTSSSSSNVRIVKGAARSAKERSVLAVPQEDCTTNNTPRDRAIERRLALKSTREEGEALSSRLMADDLAEIEQIHQQTNIPISPKLSDMDGEESAKSPMAQAILQWLKKESPKITSFRPGRMAFSFAITDAAVQRPRMILRSRSEWAPLEEHQKAVKALIQTVRDTLHKPIENPIECVERSSESEEEDMFANLEEYKPRPKKLSDQPKISRDDPLFEMTKLKVTLSRNDSPPVEDEELFDIGDEHNDAVEQEYSECFPGTYESPGFIYGLDDEDDGGDDGGKQTLTKRQRQQKESRKLDNQLSKVTRLMNDGGRKMQQ